eukprot:scaffold39959_cov64-Attheya_sp.AAC.4
MQFLPPKDYPPDEILEDGKLNPSNITYESLCAAAKKTHTNIVGKTWKPKHAKAYLWVAGWNGQGKDNIVEHAGVHALNLEEAMNNRKTNYEAYATMHQWYTQDKAYFEPWPMPSIMGGTLAWLKLNKKFTPFMKDSQGLTIWEGYTWGLCERKSYGVCPWWKMFFSSIESITAEEPYVEPSTPTIDCWYAKQLSDWLKARHYPHSGLKAILLARVKILIDQPGGLPAPLPPMTGQVVLVKDLVISLTSMVVHLMVQTTDEDTIQSAERHLKMYLSSYANLEKLFVSIPEDL